MAFDISYMGTKRRLAPDVAKLIAELPDGPVLDVFAGMCAIGEAVAPRRAVWTNDIQPFPALVGKVLCCSKRPPPTGADAYGALHPLFERNVTALRIRFSRHLRKERRYLRTGSLPDVEIGDGTIPYVGTDTRLNRERARLARQPNTFPYRLFTITYPGTFFGVSQCIEIDSIRYAIDVARDVREISQEEWCWFLAALGLVCTRINNSTGQFAQYLTPNVHNINRIVQKRRRSVWAEFVDVLPTLATFGDSRWRSQNRSYRTDAGSLLRRLAKSEVKPSVVYADPPYSNAQYSRYYHVLDVLLEYNYPAVTAKGRYPANRYQTPYSNTGTVTNAITTLVQSVAALKANMILSYPANGLFLSRGGDLLGMLKTHFRSVRLGHRASQEHSTFGGLHAPTSVSVTEEVFVALP